ncbi:MAG: protein kinase [Candidatus Eremiobacterota bacterium]
MEIICPACGTHTNTDESFCYECGFVLTESSLPSVPQYNKTDNNRYSAEAIVEKRISVTTPQKTALVLPDGFLLKEKYRLKFFTVGGMASIYQAIDIMTDLKYIIKEAYSPDINEKEIMTMALLQERDTLARLSHPGIVKAIDLFQYLGTYYLVLEYVQGKNLDVYAKKMGIFIDEKDVLSWSLQVCETLDYLHNLPEPLIYRDIKPENLIVDVFGRVKLIDFGIARSFKEHKSKDTMAIGTPGFAAPEQYGKKQTDHRSDIYSLGATMHYLMSGSDPRERENPLLFPPLENFNSSISQITKKIINKAIKLERDERYQTSREMKSDIEYALKEYGFMSPSIREPLEPGRVKTFGDIHPGLLSFVLPVLTSFLTIFSIGIYPLSFLSPFIVGLSFIAGTIMGVKGIIRDLKSQSYGMLVISIMGTAINLLPTIVVVLVVVALIFSGFF